MCRSSQIHTQIFVSKTLLKVMEVPHISHTLTYWLNIPQRQKTKAQFPLCYRMQKQFLTSSTVTVGSDADQPACFNASGRLEPRTPLPQNH